MSFLLTLLLLAVLLACVAMTYAEGMWSNAIRLINVILAGLLALNYFEPVADWLNGQRPSGTYVWDFAALWGLFIVFTVVLRELTDRASRVKVRFLELADQIGSWVFAVWTGLVLVGFTLLALHTAPLSQNFLFGGFNHEQRMFLGLALDREWLGFMRKMSRGAFCRSASPEEWKEEKYVFDSKSAFMTNYAARRAALEKQIADTDTLFTK